MWHCSQSFPACESSTPHPPPHHQGLPGSEVYQQFPQVSVEPGGFGIRRLGRLGTCLPGFHSCRGGLPAPGSAHPTTTTPINRETEGKEGVKLCRPTRQREAGASGSPGNRSWAGRTRRTEKLSPSSYRAPSSALGAQGLERDSKLPRRRGNSWLQLHASRAPQPSWAPARRSRRSAPGGGRGSPLASHRLPANDPPETPEESCAARGPDRRAARGPERRPPRAAAHHSRVPPLTAPRRGFVLSGVASPAWAQAPEPLPGPLLCKAPGPPAPSEPNPQRASRAMGAGGRRATGCAAAASGGATASRAGAGGWVWAKGEEGGTRRALRLAGGRRKPQRHQSPGRRGWEGGTGTPSRCGTPTSSPPRFLALLLLSEDSRLSAFASTRARIHGPLPCQASLASTCSSF